MINLLYVLHTHNNIEGFAAAAIPDAHAVARVAEMAKIQTEYTSCVIVNEYLFIAFRAAIARGEILPENIRMTLAHDGEKETRCVFNSAGVPLLESDKLPVHIGNHDVFEDLLLAIGELQAEKRRNRTLGVRADNRPTEEGKG